MTDYIYKARDDKMDRWALNFTSRMGDGSSDHEQAYLDMLRLLVELKRDGAIMDIGCGLGRVIKIVEGRISRVVGLEPDIERYAACYAGYHSPPACQIYNQMSDEYIAANPGAQFDLVVLSMVIQHVATHLCDVLLADACRLVKPDGIVVVATSLVPESVKGYSKSADPGNAYLSEQEYNDYAMNPHAQDKGIPVRRFSRKDLESAVSPYFEILQWTQFSYYRPERIQWFCTVLRTDADTLKDTGNSQFVILRKRS